jgi:endonuclease YncB( thermonuclease family)
MTARVLLFLLLAVAPLDARAAAVLPANAPKAAETAKVTEVTDGDTLVLSNRETVRLVGVQAPKLPLDRPNFKEWPLARESKKALEALSLGRALTLHPTSNPKDRWGRVLAHLERDDGVWIQGEMLRQGWARVYTFADNRQLAADMLALEREARAARRGIWADPYYSIVTPERAGKVRDTFQLVEGRVMQAADVKGRVYLNFGTDWKTDFTVVVPSRVRKTLARLGHDPAALQGKTVRVRGWIKEYNGPMIELTHPEQLEFPDAPPVRSNIRSKAQRKRGEPKLSP